MDNSENQEQNLNQGGQEPVVKYELPNATAVLILGILSIILFCCFFIGLVLGIIGLYLASKDMKLYQQNPMNYTENSFKNLKIGRICAIIGLVLSVVYIAYWIISFAMVGFNPEFWEQMREAMEEAKKV